MLFIGERTAIVAQPLAHRGQVILELLWSVFARAIGDQFLKPCVAGLVHQRAGVLVSEHLDHGLAILESNGASVVLLVGLGGCVDQGGQCVFTAGCIAEHAGLAGISHAIYTIGKALDHFRDALGRAGVGLQLLEHGLHIGAQA